MNKITSIRSLKDVKALLNDLESFRGVIYLDQEFKDIDGLIQTIENQNSSHLSASLKEELERSMVLLIEGKVVSLRDKIQAHLDRIKAAISGTQSIVNSSVSTVFTSGGSGESGSRSTGESGYRTSSKNVTTRSSESSGRGGYSG